MSLSPGCMTVSPVGITVCSSRMMSESVLPGGRLRALTFLPMRGELARRLSSTISIPIERSLTNGMKGRLPAGACAVCVLTGHGLKDPQFAIEQVPAPLPIPATLDAVVTAAGLVP